MIISHTHRFIFVEIPHTASHSISEQLVKHYSGEPILRKHANLTQFLGQASKDERSYFKFATVRNPLDTATTDYSKLKNNHKGQYNNSAMFIENGGHVTREHRREFDFIRNNNATFPEFFKKFRAKLYNNWFLVGDQKFDYVIRFEALQTGFTEVLNRMNIKQQEPIPHVNRTKGKEKSFEDFFTPEVQGLAAASYGPFMRKWGYSFPQSWGNVSIPAWSRLQFDVLDRAIRLAASFITLDPDHPVLFRAKKTVDLVTRKTG